MSRDNNIRKLSFLGFNTTDDDGKDSDEIQLDDEMEKVFAGSKGDSQKFDLSKLSDTGNVKKQDDENGSRKSSLALKTQRKPMNRSDSKDSPSESAAHSDDSTTQNLSKQDTLSPSSSITDEPQLSERAADYGDRYSESSNDGRKIHFDKKQSSQNAEVINLQTDDAEERDEDRRRRKERHQHYKHHRKYSGDNTNSNRKISVQAEDAELEEADIDDLTSHRSDDPRGMRRPKIQPTDYRTGRKMSRDQTQTSGVNKKIFDRNPHEVFVQLNELTGHGEEREWKETARWIKYEEDVEEGSDRWGRPHVAPLSFHSLLNLRRCLETGVVLLDLEERDLPGVAYRVVEQMVVDELIHEQDKATVMRALLVRYRHANENSSGFHFGSKRKFSSYTSLQNLSDDRKPKIVPSTDINGHSGPPETKIDLKEETYSASQEDLKKMQNDTILKRIPVGAEATTVLVGAVEFLEQPTIAFIRLAEGIPIPTITEVPIPVRFLFILMGPKMVDLDYHEVGRSIATLMSTEHFHRIAYKAEDRRELLSAINEFLDDSIVLPPGKWAHHDLLPFEELKAKSDWIRQRKEKALQEKNKDKAMIADEEKRLLVASDGDDGGEKRKKGPLEKTYRPWGGLINDVKRRWPLFMSDIKDGLNTETVAATLFMYFAALSTAITFGGLASDKTNNLIGISETLISASVVGLIFHAIAGQPLTIIGTTGPLLLFDEALCQFCTQNDYNFLTVRLYVGIWLIVISLVVSAFEGSVYVRLFTRFTQEIFSALITLIYIVETAMKTIAVYKRHPLYSQYNYLPEQNPVAVALISSNQTDSIGITDNETILSESLVTTTVGPVIQQIVSNMTNLLPSEDVKGKMNQPNTALFCTILTLGTFGLAYYLKIFRNSHFLGRNARRALGDFGVPIAIVIFTALSICMPQVYTEKLSVPDGISPSNPAERGWLIPMGPVPIWLPFVCGIPALLVYILAFMETHISELIVDKPERGLKKGSGLHLDIVILSIMNCFCGFFGMPWHCAATVRSVTHVSAVTIMSKTHAPGEKAHIIDVKEQRISGLFVSLLVGLSVTMAPILKLIPMAVLFGVFLYMGIASMSGVQFFERVGILFMPVKYHPTTPFVKRVPTWKIHLFTIIQITALAILWAVKSSSISLAFPFFLIMMVPLRQKLEQFYSKEELAAIDGNQTNADNEDEPDFYEEAPIPA